MADGSFFGARGAELGAVSAGLCASRNIEMAEQFKGCGQLAPERQSANNTVGSAWRWNMSFPPSSPSLFWPEH